jgi:hypothetical protein
VVRCENRWPLEEEEIQYKNKVRQKGNLLRQGRLLETRRLMETMREVSLKKQGVSFQKKRRQTTEEDSKTDEGLIGMALPGSFESNKK